MSQAPQEAFTQGHVFLPGPLEPPKALWLRVGSFWLHFLLDAKGIPPGTLHPLCAIPQAT